MTFSVILLSVERAERLRGGNPASGGCRWGNNDEAVRSERKSLRVKFALSALHQVISSFAIAMATKRRAPASTPSIMFQNREREREVEREEDESSSVTTATVESDRMLCGTKQAVTLDSVCRGQSVRGRQSRSRAPEMVQSKNQRQTLSLNSGSLQHMTDSRTCNRL
ncbi:hypothetical protein F2P81_008352 [Scophthalmus maximus]|uniref:Uncharacterized protein n=1 Tax=Scophthalmus maximus TaxID=52904 RepID=A0A6A4T222_SCOMX|nr:hypothetical protein F2P81_008352 [Scophthalmus maximus]